MSGLLLLLLLLPAVVASAAVATAAVSAVDVAAAAMEVPYFESGILGLVMFGIIWLSFRIQISALVLAIMLCP